MQTVNLYELCKRLHSRVIVATWLGAMACVIAVSLWSYNPYDTSFFVHATVSRTTNILGPLGAHVAALCSYLCAGISWLFVPLLLWYAYIVLYRTLRNEWERIIASIIGIISCSVLMHWYSLVDGYSVMPGGYCGSRMFWLLTAMVEPLVVSIFVHMLALISFILVTRFFYMPFAVWVIRAVHSALIHIDERRYIQRIAYTTWRVGTHVAITVKWMYEQLALLFSGKLFIDADMTLPEDVQYHEEELHALYQSFFVVKDNHTIKQNVADVQKDYQEVSESFKSDNGAVVDNTTCDKSSIDNKVAHETTLRSDNTKKRYTLPDVSIFIGVDEEKNDEALTKELAERAELLTKKLEHFGIKGSITSINRGPVVTVYEYEPSINTKLSKILALEDDLAMALKALSIRILAPIPGKSVVGFEVANDNRKGVVLATGIQSDAYRDFPGALPLVLGEDTSGNSVIVDLVKMPHLLVAGSTGSGKSVGLNTMLMSLLCKRNPDDLKLILIDPKRLEFASYTDIAHLLFPIVVNPKRSVGILRWAVGEMETRYEKMANVGVRNIVDYNACADKAGFDRLPYIVIVIDELADLMMTSGKEIEDLIARIAQMARASGIHMILATQRPSVDVITGLIKVNFPSRISFRVTSRVDSRTILDVSGAEKLLGRGDMLFLDSTQSNLRRIHGAYVSDKEIRDVVAHIKSLRSVSYLELSPDVETDKNQINDRDELFDEVVDFIQELDGVSISLLQRKFRIGYNRSARIIDDLEKQGLIMPQDGSKLRKVVR